MRLPFLRRPGRAETVAAAVTKSVRMEPGFVALHQAGSANWTGRSYSAMAQTGYMKNPVAHRCVRLIAEAAASVPLLLYEGRNEHDAHPMLALLTAPNPRMAGAEFIEALCGQLMIAGNAYVEAVKRAMPIHIAAMYELRGAVSRRDQPATVPAGYERLIAPYRRRML